MAPGVRIRADLRRSCADADDGQNGVSGSEAALCQTRRIRLKASSGRRCARRLVWRLTPVATMTAPRMVILAGPNGAGKTTASKRLLRDALAITEFVNADAIASGLSAFAPNPW